MIGYGLMLLVLASACTSKQPAQSGIEVLTTDTIAASVVEEDSVDITTVVSDTVYQPNIVYQSTEGIVYSDLFWDRQKSTRSQAMVYDSEFPNKASVIDTLDPGVAVNTVGYLNLYDTLLHEVDYAEKKGFLSLQDLFLFQWQPPNSSGLLKASLIYGARDSNNFATPQIEVQAFETNTQNLISRIVLPMYSHGFHMEKTFNCVLKNAEVLFNANRYRMSCPGGDNKTFVAYHNGRFTELITVRTSGEMGMYSNQFLYLPTLIEDGSIRMVHNSAPLTYPTPDSSRFRFFEVPDTIKVPIHELVVMEEEVADGIMNPEQTQYLKNEDGSYQIEIVKYEVTYYRWDGTKLKPLL